MNAFKYCARTNNSRFVSLLISLDHKMTCKYQTKHNHFLCFFKTFLFLRYVKNLWLYNPVQQWSTTHSHYLFFFAFGGWKLACFRCLVLSRLFKGVTLERGSKEWWHLSPVTIAYSFMPKKPTYHNCVIKFHTSCCSHLSKNHQSYNWSFVWEDHIVIWKCTLLFFDNKVTKTTRFKEILQFSYLNVFQNH